MSRFTQAPGELIDNDTGESVYFVHPRGKMPFVIDLRNGAPITAREAQAMADKSGAKVIFKERV